MNPIPILEVIIPIVRMEVPAPVSEANISSTSSEMNIAIATIDKLTMPIANLPMEPNQKEMSSTFIPVVVAFVEEIDILSPVSKIVTFEIRALSQERAVVPIVEPWTQISEDGPGPIAEGPLHRENVVPSLIYLWNRPSLHYF